MTERTANVNCRALIHEVQVPINDYSLSTSDLRELQDQAEREQSAILDIYAPERTVPFWRFNHERRKNKNTGTAT